MNKKQNPDELRAKQYLQTLQYTKLEYEPLGNVTPDFVMDDKVAIEVRRLNRNHMKNEHLVRVEDSNDSLWVISELHKNLQLVIDEKNQKIDTNFDIYYEWWLILVDYISYGMSSENFELLKDMQIDKHRFSKIFIISPEGEFKVFKL